MSRITSIEDFGNTLVIRTTDKTVTVRTDALDGLVFNQNVGQVYDHDYLGLHMDRNSVVRRLQIKTSHPKVPNLNVFGVDNCYEVSET